MKQIQIGTCIQGKDILSWLPHIVRSGFETVQLYYNGSLEGADFVELAKRVDGIVGDSGVAISGIGLYCNPLQHEDQLRELEYCINHARLFHAGVISTFAGALEGESVPAAMPAFRKVFSELAKRAEANGVKIGIENCPMYGFWYRATCNIGYCPKAWEMMFQEVPSDALGLEWEPSHQLEQLIEPIPQLKEWAHKVVHVHGKDANVDMSMIRRYGVLPGTEYCSHRFPGFGDSDWGMIISVLRENGYEGDICVEGFHDPVYRGEWEMTGQMHALNYLKWCRGGEYRKNPWD